MLNIKKIKITKNETYYRTQNINIENISNIVM